MCIRHFRNIVQRLWLYEFYWLSFIYKKAWRLEYSPFKDKEQSTYSELTYWNTSHFPLLLVDSSVHRLIGYQEEIHQNIQFEYI